MPDNDDLPVTGEEEQDPPDATTGDDDPTQQPPATDVAELTKRLAALEEENKKYTTLLKERNDEEKKRRLKLAALEKEKEEAELATKSETEKLQVKLSKLEAEMIELREFKRNTLARDKLLLAAENAKIEFASLRARDTAIDILLRAITVDDEGAIEGADDALNALTAEHDYLLKKETPTQPPVPPKPPKTNAEERGGKAEPLMDEETRQQKAAIYGVKAQHIKPRTN